MRGISFWFFISAMFYGVGSIIFGIQMSAGQGQALPPPTCS
ncbi:hypothetical protein V6L77_09860 [Pannonibacter sp. Pt2-lr]